MSDQGQNHMDPVKRALRDFMASLSNKYYFASWLDDLEYELFDILSGYRRGFGIDEEGLTSAEHGVLYTLYMMAGGWWVFPDEVDETHPEMDSTWTYQFLSFEAWEKLYAEYRERVERE